MIKNRETFDNSNRVYAAFGFDNKRKNNTNKSGHEIYLKLDQDAEQVLPNECEYYFMAVFLSFFGSYSSFHSEKNYVKKAEKLCTPRWQAVLVSFDIGAHKNESQAKRWKTKNYFLLFWYFWIPISLLPIVIAAAINFRRTQTQGILCYFFAKELDMCVYASKPTHPYTRSYVQHNGEVILYAQSSKSNGNLLSTITKI